jgi:hypothetical protein
MVYLREEVIMKNYNKEDFLLNINTFGNSRDIKFMKLKKMRFFSNVNKHSKIQIRFLFDEEELKILNTAVKDPESEITAGFTDGENKSYFFEGYILSIKIMKITEKLFSCELYGISKTIDLDREYTNKVYQNSDYRTFYEDLKKETDKIYISEEILSEKLKTFIVRYKETPWQIAKRIASHKESVLYSQLSNVMFGRSNVISEYNLNEEYSVINETVFRNGSEIFVKLIVETKDLFLTGDKVSIVTEDIGKTFIVGGSYIKLCNNKKTEKYVSGGDFQLSYVLVDENWKYRKKIYNEKLNGLVLHGEVLENDTESYTAKSKIMFYENLEFKYNLLDAKPEEAEEYCSIPYTIPYSKDKSGLFTAPESMDNVLLGFMNKEDESIYIMGAVYNGDDRRFTNNNYRNYFTSGSKIELDSAKSRILLEAGRKYAEKTSTSKLLADNIIVETEKFEGI